MALNTLGNLFSLVRELNLNTIKEEAERPFALLIAGAEPEARTLAAQLSAAPGKVGTHPWLHVQPLPLLTEGWTGVDYDLALLVLAQAEPDEVEGAALRRLSAERVPTVTVVVGAEAATQVGAALARPGEKARVLLPTLDVATVAAGLGPALVEALPGNRRLALARQLPPLRAALVRELVEEASRANALYAASTGLGEVVPVLNLPLAAADIVVLTKNQLVMAFKIALAAGKQGEPRAILGEVVSVLGGSFLFRQVARELIGLIPVVGIVPKIAVAYAGTWVIGRTVFLWATEGQRLNPAEMRHFYDEAIARGRTLADSLVARLHDRPTALPKPEGETTPQARWWHRFRPKRRAARLAPPSGTLALPIEPRPSFWQRLRRRLPGGR